MEEPYSGEVSQHDRQHKGFHTFVMTGDAIIRTNYNPFKPTRQLSLDSHTKPKVKNPKHERSVSNEDTVTNGVDNTGSGEDNNETIPEAAETGEAVDEAATTVVRCPQSKLFIPGFIRVDETLERNNQSGNGKRTVHTEDSGIDVQLSDDESNSPRSRSSDEPHDISDSHPIRDKDIIIVDTESNAETSIDEASAKRLATRLYQLDGFKLSDVCHYLSKRLVH